MQSTDTILMIEPIAFGFNAQTAVNNYFQVNDESKETQSEALKEFNAFVDKLRSKGVNIITVKILWIRIRQTLYSQITG